MASPLSIGPAAGPAPVASWRHTARLVAILLVLAASGVLLQHRTSGAAVAPDRHPSLIPLYASLIAAEWLLFRAVVAGLRAREIGWRVLVGRTAADGKDLARGALFGFLLCASWLTLVLALRSASADHAEIVRSLVPQNAAESGLWILLSLSAGFCEEITFRGYFQRQFEALTGSRGVALVMQAALFGIAHAYQGLSSALAIAAYGALFGALARWRGSLRAGMVAHALTDLFVGLGGH
jgi:membrane protease YdiL (CAAX protease family)